MSPSYFCNHMQLSLLVTPFKRLMTLLNSRMAFVITTEKSHFLFAASNPDMLSLLEEGKELWVGMRQILRNFYPGKWRRTKMLRFISSTPLLGIFKLPFEIFVLVNSCQSCHRKKGTPFYIWHALLVVCISFHPELFSDLWFSQNPPSHPILGTLSLLHLDVHINFVFFF